MKTWKAVCTGLVSLASLTPQLPAQVPAVPAAPAPDLAAAPTGVAPSGLAKFLGLTKDQKEAMKRRCCKTQFGQFLNNAMAPMRMFTGGIVGNFCPAEPSLADLAKGGPEGAANKIKKDELEAKARRAAVRYLGTVDCHYWPEAEAALIAALRADRNECVRFEAAAALGGGCCCTKKTMEALLIAAIGSDKDGNPAETCERVKAAAYESLQRCLSCFSQEVPGEIKKGPEVPVPEKVTPEKVEPTAVAPGGDAPVLTPYYYNLHKKPMAQIVEEARRATESFSVGGSAVPAGGLDLPGGHRGLADIVSASFASTPRSTPASSDSHVVANGPSEHPRMMAERTPLRERLQMRNATPAMPVASTEMKASVVTEVKPSVTVEHRAMPSSKPVVMPAVSPAVAPVVTPAVTTPQVPVITPAVAPAPVMPPAPPVPSMPVMPAPVAPQTHSRAPIGPNPQQLMLVLRNSSYPFQREWAVNELSNVDWHGNPEVVQCLLNCAQKDSAPTVRVACVKALVKMKVETVPVQMTLQALKNDTDPRVQREATVAVSGMRSIETVSATPANTVGGVRQAGMPVSVTPVTPASFTVSPAKNAFSR